MKNPNGYGCVKKLSGNRRRPWAVYVTTGWTLPTEPQIDALRGFVSESTYETLKQEIALKRKIGPHKAKQKQTALGYYATRQEAMIALAEYNKQPYNIDAKNATVEDVYLAVHREKIQSMNYSARTGYQNAWQKCGAIKRLKIADVRKADMQSVLDSYSDMSASTLANIVKLLHLIFSFALENDIVSKDYSQFVRAKSTREKIEKRPFSREEIAELLTDLEKNGTVLTLILTGLRASEFLALTPEDVDLDERLITVHGTKTASADRLVPIHSVLMPIIEDVVASKPKHYTQLHRIMERYHHSPHECRHTFATLAQEADLDPFIVKRILGHKTQNLTLDVYTHVYRERLVKEIEKIDLLLTCSLPFKKMA